MGAMELYDRENGRPVWGGVALATAALTLMWSFGLIASALVPVLSFYWR